MSNERDELAEVIRGIDGPATLGGLEVADAILTAGYRKPRQVATADEMEALPVGSVVLDRDGMALQKTEWRFRGTGWNALNGTRDIYREELERDCFPATVLHIGSTA